MSSFQKYTKSVKSGNAPQKMCENILRVGVWNAHKLKLYAFLNKKSIGLLETSALNAPLVEHSFSHRQKNVQQPVKSSKNFSVLFQCHFTLGVCVCAKGQKVPLKSKMKKKSSSMSNAKDFIDES